VTTDDRHGHPVALGPARNEQDTANPLSNHSCFGFKEVHIDTVSVHGRNVCTAQSCWRVATIREPGNAYVVDEPIVAVTAAGRASGQRPKESFCPVISVSPIAFTTFWNLRGYRFSKDRILSLIDPYNRVAEAALRSYYRWIRPRRVQHAARLATPDEAGLHFYEFGCYTRESHLHSPDQFILKDLLPLLFSKRSEEQDGTPHSRLKTAASSGTTMPPGVTCLTSTTSAWIDGARLNVHRTRVIDGVCRDAALPAASVRRGEAAETHPWPCCWHSH